MVCDFQAGLELLAQVRVDRQWDVRSIRSQHPKIVEGIVSWIREAADVEDWGAVVKLINCATPFRPVGLGEVIQEILDLDPPCSQEDLVEILGEIREAEAVESVACLVRVAERSVVKDAPAYWLCQKVIASLSDIGTPAALERLRQMTASPWPDFLRWHAAVALQIEDELGFDEDRMLG